MPFWTAPGGGGAGALRWSSRACLGSTEGRRWKGRAALRTAVAQQLKFGRIRKKNRRVSPNLRHDVDKTIPGYKLIILEVIISLHFISREEKTFRKVENQHVAI